MLSQRFDGGAFDAEHYRMIFRFAAYTSRTASTTACSSLERSIQRSDIVVILAPGRASEQLGISRGGEWLALKKRRG